MVGETDPSTHRLHTPSFDGKLWALSAKIFGAGELPYIKTEGGKSKAKVGTALTTLGCNTYLGMNASQNAR